MIFRRFHFFKVTKEVESYHSVLLSHVYLGWPVAWVDVGGGCYRLVSERGFVLFGECLISFSLGGIWFLVSLCDILYQRVVSKWVALSLGHV